MPQTFSPDDGSDNGERSATYEIPDQYSQFDVCHILPNHYNDNVEPCPSTGADALANDLEDNGDGTQTLTIDFTRRGYGRFKAPSEDDYDKLEAWVEGLVEWLNEEEPELGGVSA